MDLSAQLAALEQAFLEQRLEEVKTQAEGLIAAHPQRLEGYLYASKAYLVEQKPIEANYYLYRAREVQPDNEEVLANLAHIALESREVDSARYYYNLILEKNPSSWPALIGKGDCAYAYEEHEYAINDYQAALESGAGKHLSDNEYAIVLYKAAHACLSCGQYERGLELLQKHAPSSFQEPLVLVERDIYRLMGKEYQDKTVELTERLHQNLPLNERYLLDMAEISKARGDNAKTDEMLSKLLALESVGEERKTEAYYERARLRLDAGNYAGALEDYNGLIAQKPEWYYYEERALVKEQLKDFKGALQDINQALQMQEQPTASSLLQRGRLMVKGNALEQAVADFTRVLKIDPKNADACYELGAVYNKQGDMNKSFKFLVDAEVNGHQKAHEMLTTKFAKQLSVMRERAAQGFLAEFQPQFERNAQSPILQRAFGKLWIPDMNRIILAMGDEIVRYSKDTVKRILDEIAKEMLLITPQGMLYFENADSEPIEAYYKVEVESTHAILLEAQPTKGGERFGMRFAFYEDSLLFTYPIQETEVQPKYFVEATAPSADRKTRLKTKKIAEAKYLAAIEELIARLSQ